VSTRVWHSRWLTVVALAAGATILAGAGAAHAKIYLAGSFISEGVTLETAIRSANLDGSGLATVQSDPAGFANDLALDLPDGKMFWTDTNAESVRSANLNGTDVHNVSDLLGARPHGIAVDPVNKKLFVTERGAPKGIVRMNFDGTNVETLSSEPGASYGYIAIDVGAQTLYWADQNAEGIFRAPIAKPLVVEKIVSGQPFAFGVAIDAVGAKVYWEEIGGENAILRANLDGSGVQALLTRPGAGMDGGIAVDPAGGRIYWTEPSFNDVAAANLDGSSPASIFSTPGFRGEGIALGPTRPTPINTSAPSIEGSPQPAGTLTCHEGSWVGAGPISFAYQWGVAGGSTIVGATGTSFTPSASDVGRAIACIVTASDNIESAIATSAAVPVGRSAALVLRPLIAGFALSRLTTSHTSPHVGVFTTLAGTATLVARPIVAHRAAHVRTAASRARTITVSKPLNAGRGSITIRKLLRGTVYRLTLTVASGDGQIARDKMTLRVSRR
jgi:hypothetical protein